MEISKNLKMLRLNMGLTQTQLSELIGITQNVYTIYESGRSMPGGELLIKMADAFNCSIDYLVGRENEEGNIIIKENKTIPESSPANKIYFQLNNRNKFRFLSYGQGLLDGQNER